MEITQCVDRYALRHDIAPSTLMQLRTAARLFSRWGGGVNVEQLEDELVNRWLAARTADGRSPRTVRGNRTAILMLWRDALAAGETANTPQRVRRIRCPQLNVEGYDAAQMTLLVRTAERLGGCFRGSAMPRAVWWKSLLLTAWDSSLRLGDLFALERGWIWPAEDDGGFVSLIQGKTGAAVRHCLRPETLTAIDECMSHGGSRRLIWAGFLSRRHFYQHFRKLADASGLRGTSKWIRRGSASEVERLERGAGAIHLGHRTLGMFEEHYRVDRICQVNVPLPPAIG